METSYKQSLTYQVHILLKPVVQVWVHPHLMPWTLPLVQISLNGSIWSTVTVTLERYLTIVHPR